MNSFPTYRPKSPDTNIGGYRYFFNGQEVDNEVYGENGLFAFEYRMHDARLGRFWSVDPLAAKYPWNSSYAFAENSPIGYLELEGLEKVQFGKHVVPFSQMNKDDVKSNLRKYKDYHHGNITVKEIMQTDNDNEYWNVSDISDTYMRSIGTHIVKFNEDKTATLSDEVRMNFSQFITLHGYKEGGHDGSNSGRLTSEDWYVGGTIVITMTGIGAMVEGGGITILSSLELLNNLDDVIGIILNGKESLTQSLTSSNKKIVGYIKSAISAVGAGMGLKSVKNNISHEKYFNIMNSIMDMIGTGNNVKKNISDDESTQQPK